ncbi:MAG: hypothetical protein N3F09_10900, partial [Bacteroidia bacterium]|nr:hypothetical protein [Bacteroidia bacterium]
IAASLGYFIDTSGIISSKPLALNNSGLKNREYRILYGCRNVEGILLDTTFDPVFITDEDLGRAYFIKSINYVIKRISCPDTVKFILPSHMAFGEKGYYTIIPPHTPLVYTLIKTINEKK